MLRNAGSRAGRARRTLLAALAAGAVLTSTGIGPAMAAARCTDTAEREMFDVTALKSRLMVLATGCGTDTQYNAFMTRYRPQLAATDKQLQAWFSHHYGKSGQREYDSFITSLANSQSDVGISEGSDFCPHDTLIFSEVLALPQTADLPAYAAGKDLVPASIATCPETTTAAPAARGKR